MGCRDPAAAIPHLSPPQSHRKAHVTQRKPWISGCVSKNVTLIINHKSNHCEKLPIREIVPVGKRHAHENL